MNHYEIRIVRSKKDGEVLLYNCFAYIWKRELKIIQSGDVEIENVLVGSI